MVAVAVVTVVAKLVRKSLLIFNVQRSCFPRKFRRHYGYHLVVALAVTAAAVVMAATVIAAVVVAMERKREREMLFLMPLFNFPQLSSLQPLKH